MDLSYPLSRKLTSPISIPLDGSGGGGPGPNLILNGDFADGSVWTLGNGWSIGAGSASRIDAGGGSVIYQDVVLVNGESYLIEFDILAMSLGSDVYTRLYGGVDVFGPSATGVGHYSATLVANAGNNIFAIVMNTADGTCQLDNVSVRKL